MPDGGGKEMKKLTFTNRLVLAYLKKHHVDGSMWLVDICKSLNIDRESLLASIADLKENTPHSIGLGFPKDAEPSYVNFLMTNDSSRKRW